MNSINALWSRSPHILFQAWKALSMHRLRNFLGTLGIVFAVAAVVIMMAIAEGAKKKTMEQIADLGSDRILVRNSRTGNEDAPVAPFHNMPGSLGNRDVAAIKQIPGVLQIIVVKGGNAFFDELGEANVIHILAVRYDYFAARGLELAWGRFISDIDAQNAHQVCVLGAALSKHLQDEGLDGTVHMEGAPYRVVGVLRPRGDGGSKSLPVTFRDFDNAAFVPLSEMSGTEVFADGNEYFSEMIIKISETRFIGPISKAVHHALLWNRDGTENFEMIVPNELLFQARQAGRLFNVILGSIAGTLLLLGGVGIMNIMMANVSERTREIGIRRAVGARRGQIVAHFLGESVLLTILGGILGIVIGLFAVLGVNFFIQWRVSISLWSVFSALFMSIGVGVVSGIYPAMKAADMDPVDALRQI